MCTTSAPVAARSAAACMTSMTMKGAMALRSEALGVLPAPAVGAEEGLFTIFPYHLSLRGPQSAMVAPYPRQPRVEARRSSLCDFAVAGWRPRVWRLIVGTARVA